MPDGLCVIEEARVSTDLLKMRLAEGGLKDDVQDALHNRILFVDEIGCDWDLLLARLIDDDLAVFALVLSLRDLELTVDGLQGEEHLARRDVGSQAPVKEARLLG